MTMEIVMKPIGEVVSVAPAEAETERFAERKEEIEREMDAAKL